MAAIPLSSERSQSRLPPPGNDGPFRLSPRAFREWEGCCSSTQGSVLSMQHPPCAIRPRSGSYADRTSTARAIYRPGVIACFAEGRLPHPWRGKACFKSLLLSPRGQWKSGLAHGKGNQNLRSRLASGGHAPYWVPSPCLLSHELLRKNPPTLVRDVSTGGIACDLGQGTCLGPEWTTKP